ncbi:hypothetical protein J7E25_03195 [Agromyces sp. ISL-38]|uniref:hypothetical protein n=1 Tax=Agromyces sp. ISL-38 TaxID=2819107 RepID=UPI001BE8A849|nr:hypothetical protein [Agromyces sp. ISL-38]MBT2498093.1 hypothetical protein [Agromyces sp. ISL-38]MBT2519356.1 hypothetical protein [Streptomyces sp. ISL-90]
MSDPGPLIPDGPEDPNAAEELDAAVHAVEQHHRAEEDADPEERVVVRDPETGEISEEPAQ